MKLVVVFLGILGVSYGSIIPPPPQDECASPTGGEGLGAAVKDLVDLLPLIDMLTIYVKAVSIDPEVQQVVEYIESEEFHKIVSTMNNCQEYIDILEYFCEELHFHVYYYLNSAAEFLGLPKVTRPPSVDDRRRRDTRARPGFQGMLEDLGDVIPIDKLREVYKKRYEEDEYLRLAMEKIGSDEFRKIGDAIEALPEYQEMLTELRKLGVDVDAILEALMDFFNWHPR